MAHSKKKKRSNENEPASLPLRVACVDMGSNAIRFVAAEFMSQTEYEVLASERRPVRLGHSVFLSGVLDAQAMDQAVAALVDFKSQMDELEIEHYRAVATSAVREAKNGDEFVSFKGHHKHSLYLISNTELPTFNQREVRMVANIARYHRKAHLSEHHHDFMALSEEERERVTMLAVILRVADSLDREHLQRVTGVTAKITDDEVSLWLDGTAGILLEGWTLKQKGNLFSKIFGRGISLRFLGEEQAVEA